MELIQSITNIFSVKAWRPVAAIAAAGLLLFQGSSAIAQDLAESFCPSEGTQPHQFASVVSGDAFFTVDNEEVRLAGVLAPGSDGNYASSTTIALANAALNQAIGARALLLATRTQGRDRYGRVVAQVFVDGDWLQAGLLQSGWVRAAPDLVSASCAGALLEAEARASNAGHWADGRFDVLSVEELTVGERRFAGSFQIVEGSIVDVGDFRGRYFLNFGEDYKTDFTVTISPADMRYFRAAGLDLNSLEGKRVRVRGWLESYNGPNMPISTPDSIELLD